jgi:hypothetical protein
VTDDLINIKQTANNMAAGRVAAIGKSSRFKVNQTTLYDELVTACMYGELSAMERMLICIQNKTIALEDIEAVLHVSIVAINNHISERVGRKDTKLKLDDYLELRGYHDKPNKIAEQDLEGMRNG